MFRNGWDQVSTVYLTSSRLIAELRVQQYQRGGPREEHMRGFAGNFIVSSGIQEWTEMQGGIVCYLGYYQDTISILCNTKYTKIVMLS